MAALGSTAVFAVCPHLPGDSTSNTRRADELKRGGAFLQLNVSTPAPSPSTSAVQDVAHGGHDPSFCAEVLINLEWRRTLQSPGLIDRISQSSHVIGSVDLIKKLHCR